jgi:hypothetical protein
MAPRSLLLVLLLLVVASLAVEGASIQWPSDDDVPVVDPKFGEGCEDVLCPFVTLDDVECLGGAPDIVHVPGECCPVVKCTVEEEEFPPGMQGLPGWVFAFKLSWWLS